MTFALGFVLGFAVGTGLLRHLVRRWYPQPAPRWQAPPDLAGRWVRGGVA